MNSARKGQMSYSRLLPSHGNAVGHRLPANPDPSALPPNLKLHINSLTLHGFSVLDHHQIRVATGLELSRLLIKKGIPPALKQKGKVNQLAGTTFEMEVGISASAIGTRIAQAIYGGLAHVRTVTPSN